MTATINFFSHIFFKMKNTLLTLAIISFFLFANFSYAYPSLKVTTDTNLSQQAGTSADYTATVTNMGDMPLEEVYLTISFLPSRWYSINEKVFLQAGNSSVLHYTLSLPADVEGGIKYNVTANGVLGFGIVAQDKNEVMLKITAANSQQATMTAKTTTTQQGENVQQGQNMQDMLKNYKWILVSVLISLGIIFAMAAYVFWRD